MTPQELKNSILQLAIQGKLVEQRPEEGTAEELYRQIQREKQALIKAGKLKKEKPLPEITEDEKPFEIPEGWMWVHLNQIAESGLGKTLDKAKNTGALCPYLCSINVYWNGISLEKVKEARFSEEDRAKYRLQKGDLLICEGGEVGRTAIWDSDKEMYYQNALHRVRFFSGLFPFYFKYIIECYKGIGIIDRYSKGMTIKHLVQSSLYAMWLPFPPLAEQKRIVSKIEELLPLIDRYEQAWTRLEALNKRFPEDMQKSLLQFAIQGKLVEQRPEEGTAAELYRQIQREKQALIKAGKLKKEKPLPDITEDEKPFEIPEGWMWVRLDDLVTKEIKRGKSPTYSPKSGTLVFAQKCNTKAGYIDLSLSLFLDETKLNKYPFSEFMLDMDIVVNSTGNGTLGRVGIYRESDNPAGLPIVPDSHVTVIRTNQFISVKYVFYGLKYYQPYMEKLGSGSTNQTELSASTIKALLFPLPPLAEQKRIVARLEELLPLCKEFP